jgi:hypothetical protein
LLHAWQIGHPRKVILSAAPGSGVIPTIILLLVVLITSSIIVAVDNHVGLIDCFVVETSSPLSALLPAPEVVRSSWITVIVVWGEVLTCDLRHQPNCWWSPLVW